MPALTGAGLLRGFERCLDLLLPPACLTCDAMVDRQGMICAECFRGLAFVTAPLCDRCGLPLAHAGLGVPVAAGGAALACPTCVARPPAFAAARAALRYDAGAARLLLPFKHGDRTALAGPLARQMARAGAALLARAELIVPVPLHWRRLLARRYNQAALLSGRLARSSGVAHAPTALRRARPTASLDDRGAAERMAVLEGTITLARGAGPRVVGRRVLLVDDVLTSGATAQACARALLAAGAVAVDVLVAARVPDPRLDGGARGGPA